MALSLGMIYADIKMAGYALNEYKNNKKEKDIKNMCAYHIQQAAEKLIKYQIYQKMPNPGDREMYTHNLGALLAYAARNNVLISVPKYIKDNQEIITGWEAGSRYDLHFSIRIDTLEKAYSLVNEWYQEIKSAV